MKYWSWNAQWLLNCSVCVHISDLSIQTFSHSCTIKGSHSQSLWAKWGSQSVVLSLGCTLESLGECLKIPALARTLPQTSYNQNLWVWGPSREPPLRASMEIALAQESGDLDDIPQSKAPGPLHWCPKCRQKFWWDSGMCFCTHLEFEEGRVCQAKAIHNTSNNKMMPSCEMRWETIEYPVPPWWVPPPPAFSPALPSTLCLQPSSPSPRDRVLSGDLVLLLGKVGFCLGL